MKSLSYGEVPTPKVVEYANALYGVTEGELEEAIAAALRKHDSGFPPAPGQIWAEVETIRDLASVRYHQDTPYPGDIPVEDRTTCPEMQDWAALRDKLKRDKEKQEKQFQAARAVYEGTRLELSEQQRLLKEWYLRQDLSGKRLPRSKHEIEAIKAERRAQR